MRVVIAGQKLFGAAVLHLCMERGHDVAAVCSPAGGPERPDSLREAARAAGVPWLPAESLRAETVPDGVDLIVAAHCHDFLGRRTRGATRLGAVGYHPSLLPLHRGRDAVRWTIRLGERVTGGTVYWLSDGVDAGDVAAQAHVFVRPGDDAESLWRRELFPLGVELLARVLDDLEAGLIVRVPQRPELATWEPSLGRPPLFRPELPLLGEIPGFVIARDSRAMRDSPAAGRGLQSPLDGPVKRV